MKTKTSNKVNIVLIAITLLLLFVVGVSSIGKTNSWLTHSDQIGFEVYVPPINIVVEQTVNGSTREIDNNQYIYLDTDYIEANHTYPLNVTITNKEEGLGYYIRCQAFAIVDGVTYNINNCITGDFYKRSDNWMYSVNSNNENTAMASFGNDGSTLTLIESVKFPPSFIDLVQGQHLKLYLFIEGSATGTFEQAQS